MTMRTLKEDIIADLKEFHEYKEAAFFVMDSILQIDHDESMSDAFNSVFNVLFADLKERQQIAGLMQQILDENEKYDG